MLGGPRWRGLVFSTFMAAHSPHSHQAAFVCLLTFFFMLKGSFGAFQLVFVLAAASVRLHRKKIFGRNKERQRRRSAGMALIKGSVFGLN